VARPYSVSGLGSGNSRNYFFGRSSADFRLKLVQPLVRAPVDPFVVVWQFRPGSYNFHIANARETGPGDEDGILVLGHVSPPVTPVPVGQKVNPVQLREVFNNSLPFAISRGIRSKVLI
jgi:hypothetical protein